MKPASPSSFSLRLGGMEPYNVSTSQAEREALADLLQQSGPDAPTLCEGWTARDLAVHLVIREYRPDAAAGMFFKGLANRLDTVSHDYESKPFAELVEMYRNGPPTWNPMRLADKYANLAENFVHHEDLRRGGGEYAPRDLPQSARDDLWKAVGKMAKFFLRSSSIHVVLERTDAATPTVVRAGADSTDEVRVSGEAGELLLWLYGRDGAVDVVLTPTDEGTTARIKRHVF